MTLGLFVFGYYAISPLFNNIKVDEALPQAIESKGENTTEVSPVQNTKVVASHPVIGTVGHPASGTVRIVEVSGKKYVRYENFKTINGPDIYVYIAKDLDAKEFVNLGRVKATEGNINYEVPDGVDVSQYPYVLTWCKTFGVLFNYATLEG